MLASGWLILQMTYEDSRFRPGLEILRGGILKGGSQSNPWITSHRMTLAIRVTLC